VAAESPGIDKQGLSARVEIEGLIGIDDLHVAGIELGEARALQSPTRGMPDGLRALTSRPNATAAHMIAAAETNARFKAGCTKPLLIP
jgi:hypothetical protein